MGSVLRRPRVHYAWVVLVALMAMNAISSGIRLSFGVYIDPLVEQFGWSRGVISLAYTIQFIAAIPVVLASGWLGERVSARSVLLVGSVIASLGLVLTATMSQPWQFLLYYGVIGGGMGTATFMALLPVLVTRWFYRRQGVALGLLWTSLSWGPALLSPLMRWALDTFGWRESFIVIGIVSGVILVGGAFLLRDRPKDMGLTPYGGNPSLPQGPATAGSPIVAERALSLHQVTAKPSFWGLVGVHAFGCVGHSIPLAHMVSIGHHAGLPGLMAAGGLTALSLASLASRFSMSVMADARGARFTLAWALLFQAAPSLLLFAAGNPGIFYTYAILFGLGWGGEMVGFPIFNRQYYGERAPLNIIYSCQLMGAMMGMAAGGWVGGVLFDISGGYTWTIIVSAMANFLGLGIALLLPAYRRHALAAERG